jgi:ABC-type sulfate/molybdate transport systems ATPase subunit
VNGSDADDDALLRCADLTVARGKRAIVHNVSLELRPGELVALLGPNGAGKSTLLDCLAGALPPASGTVTRNGRLTVALQSADMAHRSVLKNVEMALAWWGVAPGERRERALAALAALHVEHLASRPAASLSGGERRRVHLARVLAVEPDILLLDEPFAGLDVESKSRLIEDSTAFLRAPGRATLVVVHDRAEAWALADRLLVLIDGELVATGTPRDVLAEPPTREVARFLGYDGELLDGDRLLLTRPPQVEIDPAGPLRARVTRTIPQEDATRLELTLDNGSVFATCPWPAPAVGDEVGIRLTGSVAFPVAPGPLAESDATAAG